MVTKTYSQQIVASSVLGEVVGMNEIGVDSISFCMFLDEEGDDVIGRTEMEVSVVVDGAGGGDNGVVDGIRYRNAISHNHFQ